MKGTDRESVGRQDSSSGSAKWRGSGGESWRGSQLPAPTRALDALLRLSLPLPAHLISLRAQSASIPNLIKNFRLGPLCLPRVKSSLLDGIRRCRPTFSMPSCCGHLRAPLLIHHTGAVILIATTIRAKHKNGHGSCCSGVQSAT